MIRRTSNNILILKTSASDSIKNEDRGFGNSYNEEKMSLEEFEEETKLNQGMSKKTRVHSRFVK